MNNAVYPIAALLGIALVLTGCDRQAEPTAAADPAAPQVAPADATRESTQAVLDPYRQQADRVLAALQEGSDHREAAALTEDLMRQGADLVPEFVRRHPHCQPYLEAALVVVEGWPDMDLDTIEADYHEDGALPRIENAAVCYHLKDLFVHPATVLVILADDEPDLAQARHEIQEVLAHATVVEASLR